MICLEKQYDLNVIGADHGGLKTFCRVMCSGLGALGIEGHLLPGIAATRNE